jgi:hypothetical protein
VKIPGSATLRCGLLVVAGLAAAGGGWLLARASGGRAPAGGGDRRPAAPGWMADEAQSRGVRFRLSYQGHRPLNLLQTAGTGVALWDYDGDGWLDICLVGQTGRSPGGRGMLLHNRGGGVFEDRTAGSGLDIPGPWHGCAIGDFDNDGRPDILLTGYGDCRLFRNQSGSGADPRFADVTARSGLAAAPNTWATSAAFADVNRDGRLDLFIGRYVRFGPSELQLCDYHGVLAACVPKSYDAQRGSLYLNAGGGRFEEVTSRWKMGDQHGKTFGVAFCDQDGDGYPDLYLANDEEPGDLYLNQNGRRFLNIGAASGTAFNHNGQAQGGMGVDWGDYDGDARPDLFVTTFLNENHSLYRNQGREMFEHVSAATGLGNCTVPYVGFGTKFFDYDNDGWLDLITASGHIQDNVAQVDHSTTYRQLLQLFRNQQGREFQEVTREAGEPFKRAIVGRGLAIGDVDNDGRQDVLIADLEGDALLLMNRAGAANHWLTLRLIGSRSNRMALGARVQVTAGGRRQIRECQTSGSYLSASDARIHFGLGEAERADLTIWWPSGQVTRHRNVAADQFVTLREQE